MCAFFRTHLSTRVPEAQYRLHAITLFTRLHRQDVPDESLTSQSTDLRNLEGHPRKLERKVQELSDEVWKQKRKTAHSIIEKKYRSRINDGMAELRYCVPSTARGRSSLDSKRPESQQGANEAAQNHSSGKVATLSNALQYIKSLELENEGLQGRLDEMQRRNNTLQKIAFSKADTNAPATSINVEARSDESNSGRAARDGGSSLVQRAIV